MKTELTNSSDVCKVPFVFPTTRAMNFRDKRGNAIKNGVLAEMWMSAGGFLLCT